MYLNYVSIYCPLLIIIVYHNVFVHYRMCLFYRWFHGKLQRPEAEKLLTPPKNGLFLVRESVAYKGDYTLCVW